MALGREANKQVKLTFFYEHAGLGSDKRGFFLQASFTTSGPEILMSEKVRQLRFGESRDPTSFFFLFLVTFGRNKFK
jgi:hypothetical protein